MTLVLVKELIWAVGPVGSNLWSLVFALSDVIGFFDFHFQYCGVNIGPVHKRDVMKASVMLEHDSQ